MILLAIYLLTYARPLIKLPMTFYLNKSHYGLHNNAIDWCKSYLHSRTQGNNLPPGKS